MNRHRSAVAGEPAVRLIEVQGGTIGRDNIDKWQVVE
jgi:hypothetical protein